MKKTHRNVEFDVHRLEDGRWEWIAYPKLGEGDHFTGVLEDDEEKATAAARAAIDARLVSVSEQGESARPFQPNPSQWGTSAWDDAAARIATSHSQRNDALLNSGSSQMFPPAPPTVSQVPPANSAATVDAPPGAVARAAPREMRLETGKYALEGSSINAGAGSLAATAEVVPAKRKPVVIRSKAQVIREAGLLITVLEEALLYQPDPDRNAYPPELWRQLNLEDRATFQLISELVAELKKLNEFLRTQRRPMTQSKVVLDLRKVGLTVLKTYGNTVAVGAGLLTIGALCTLLQHVGAGDVVENAMLWKKIGH
jgi:hypothetical protein